MTEVKNHLWVCETEYPEEGSYYITAEEYKENQKLSPDDINHTEYTIIAEVIQIGDKFFVDGKVVHEIVKAAENAERIINEIKKDLDLQWMETEENERSEFAAGWNSALDAITYKYQSLLEQYPIKPACLEVRDGQA